MSQLGLALLRSEEAICDSLPVELRPDSKRVPVDVSIGPDGLVVRASDGTLWMGVYETEEDVIPHDWDRLPDLPQD